jgi:thioredoxin 1
VVSKSEGTAEAALHEHAQYLVGKGPKPTQNTSPARPAHSPRPSSNGQQSDGRTSHSKPQAATDQTFDEMVMQSSVPVLVDFWAPWCGPCRMTEPILDKLAQQLQGKLLIAKVNVDENPRLAERYMIQSIPTMMVVKNGNVIDKWMGALPEPALRNRLSRVLG